MRHKKASKKVPKQTQTAQVDEGATEGDVDADVDADAELTPEELALLAEQEAAAEAEVIVVTGSAIERKELTTPAPVSVIDKADIDAAGLSTVGDILQNLPAQSNAINVQFNNGGDGSTRVDIRGLGSVRTLVLINGRRVVPGGTGADASVDLNAIPLAAIERVEVLKDGASAIYGSDAVGGVVNIITREDFEGQEAQVFTGTSQRGDGQVYDISFVTGANGKKSNITFGAGYNEQRPVFAGDRGYANFDRAISDWSTCDAGQFGIVNRGDNFEVGGDGVAGTEDDSQGCLKLDSGSSSTPGGFYYYDPADGGNQLWQDEVVANCPSGLCTRDENGQWRDFNLGDETGTDLYNFQPENYLYTPAQKYNVFSTGHYDLTDNVRTFYEGLYMHRFSRQQLASEPVFLDLDGLAISADNQFNPYGIDIGTYRRRLTEMGNRFFQQNIDSFRGVIGLEGNMPESASGTLKTWKWELSFNYGRTVAQQDSHGSLIKSRFQSAIGPSFQDADGVWHCGTATDPGPDECIPVNLLEGAFGTSGSITPEQAAYLTFTGVTSGYNQQKTLLAQAHGQLVKIGDGGDISAAVGVDYRNEDGAFTPDPLTATGDTTGNAIEPTAGGYHVSEGFVEVSAVPVVGKEALQWLEIDAAARAFKYNTFNEKGLGDNLTWKIGALVRTFNGLGFRGTYSTAFRAPSIGELYSGQADSFPAATDPCDTSAGPVSDPDVAMECAAQGLPDDFVNPTSQLRTRVGGNPDLGPESADIMTAGVVFEPPQVKGLAITLDYFNLQITDAVQSYGVGIILQQCYQAHDQAQCAKIQRQDSGVIDFIDDSLSNVGGNETSGLDFAIAYQHETGNAGTFRHSIEGTYLLSYYLETPGLNPDGTPHKVNGRGVYDLGVFPYIKGNYSTIWGRDAVGAGLNIRYIGGYSECEFNDCDKATPDELSQARRHVDYNVTSDLWASYRIETAAGITTAAIGVNNVLDQDPPYIDIGFLADSDAATYDYLGRYFYLRINQSF